MMEKACAAMALAYMAKANGWKEVNFGNTTDPVERMMLKTACESMNISCGNEKVWESSVEGVNIVDEGEYKDSAYVQSYIQGESNKLLRQKKDPKDFDLFAAAAGAAYMSYIETNPPIYSKHNNGSSVKPSKSVAPVRKPEGLGSASAELGM